MENGSWNEEWADSDRCPASPVRISPGTLSEHKPTFTGARSEGAARDGERRPEPGFWGRGGLGPAAGLRGGLRAYLNADDRHSFRALGCYVNDEFVATPHPTLVWLQVREFSRLRPTLGGDPAGVELDDRRLRLACTEREIDPFDDGDHLRVGRKWHRLVERALVEWHRRRGVGHARPNCGWSRRGQWRSCGRDCGRRRCGCPGRALGGGAGAGAIVAPRERQHQKKRRCTRQEGAAFDGVHDGSIARPRHARPTRVRAWKAPSERRRARGRPDAGPCRCPGMLPAPAGQQDLRVWVVFVRQRHYALETTHDRQQFALGHHLSDYHSLTGIGQSCALWRTVSDAAAERVEDLGHRGHVCWDSEHYTKR